MIPRLQGRWAKTSTSTEIWCRRFAFLEKAAIYSARTTFMSFFAAESRYRSRGLRLMVHERKLSTTGGIERPLTTCLATVPATLHEIESANEIKNEGFETLIRGSRVIIEQVLQKAANNWHIEANEAAAVGLVTAII